MTVWCDPPTHTDQRTVWWPLLEPVMARPGVWAMVRTFDRHAAAVDATRKLRRSVRGLASIALPAGQWEFVQRQVDLNEPEWGVWARYLGSPELSTAQCTDSLSDRGEVA